MDKERFAGMAMEYFRRIHSKMFEHALKLYQPYDLTPPQVSLIFALQHNDPAMISELGTALNTPDSNISAICNRLERRGIISRQRTSADRRIVHVKLTEEGKRLASTLEKSKGNMLLAIENLTDEDREKILSVLKMLVDIVETHQYCNVEERSSYEEQN